MINLKFKIYNIYWFYLLHKRTIREWFIYFFKWFAIFFLMWAVMFLIGSLIFFLGVNLTFFFSEANNLNIYIPSELMQWVV